MNKVYSKHYQEEIAINNTPERIFSYADEPMNFSSHMSKSSWMMGGGKMETKLDVDKGKKIGSHITMTGDVFGFNLFLDEIITIHESPYRKEWQTIDKINLLVIDHYALGFEITPKATGSKLKVYINYNLPNSWKTQWLGFLFGRMYAKWCVIQMITGVKEHFEKRGD